MTDNNHPIAPPPPHLLKKFSAAAQAEAKKRNGAGYLKTFAILCIEWALNSEPTPNDRQIRSSEITPPPELVEKWYEAIDNSSTSWKQELTTQAARWGADQELEACCEWLASETPEPYINALRSARRPKPPSLKEQALAALQEAAYMADDIPPEGICSDQIDIIRRALEQLND